MAVKKIAVFLVLVLLAALPGAASAAGSLDPGFGQHGKLQVRLPVGELEVSYTGKPRAARMAMAALPGGGLAAAGGSFVIERDRQGAALDRFGGDGKIRIPAPSGSKFELAALAVDSQTRVLVAGTLADLGSGVAGGTGGRVAIVYRFLPDGRPDGSFGAGGSVSGSFGQQPPATPSGVVYPEPAVGLTSMAVTPDDGIVLAGYASAQVIGCSAGAPFGATSSSFFARLDSGGAPVAGFGKGGVVSEGQIERAASLVLSPAGRIAFDGASGGYCGFRGPAESGKLVALLADGRFDPGFGESGGLPHPKFEAVTALSFDPSGRLLVLGRLSDTAPLEGGIADPAWRVKRLLPNGQPDLTFGHGGTASPKLPPRAILEGLAIDGRGRIALAGYDIRGGDGAPRRFLLTRLSPAGKREPNFGRRGLEAIGFPKKQAAALAVSAARGGLLVGGILGDPRFLDIEGLAFARYLSR
ncbi:MAG TPA: hypothetical protein VFN18_02400 [Solirubrobacterales bacterium]|nr:hypothetical protein [Solirubrobacterales bacterium]